ncbi:MAG: HAD-IA family hydrolase, partial [Candidatus Nanohaloarchaea archaeon]|nr:HAD-IA family hydrolase [Candidatus Nanohaloarchaea archaeon]
VCRDLDIDEPREFWNAIQNRGGRIKLAKAKEGTIQVYDDVDILEELQGGYRLGVVSNQPQGSVDEILTLFGLSEYLEFQRGFPDFESIENRKPDPGHIEEAMDQLDASSALFIGDNPEDRKAAERAGITPVYIDRGDYRKVEGVERIESLYELRHLLDL